MAKFLRYVSDHVCVTDVNGLTNLHLECAQDLTNLISCDLSKTHHEIISNVAHKTFDQICEAMLYSRWKRVKTHSLSSDNLEHNSSKRAMLEKYLKRDSQTQSVKQLSVKYFSKS